MKIIFPKLKKLKLLKSQAIILSALVFSPVANALTQTIFCDSPQGSRVDYFSFNNLNLQNQTFLMGRDRVSGMHPKIILDNEKKSITFIIGDAAEAAATLKAGQMQILIFTPEQVSFAGVINNAPILATYYPKESLLIYSQQSIWSHPNYQGARAVIFYAKCKVQE